MSKGPLLHPEIGGRSVLIGDRLRARVECECEGLHSHGEYDHEVEFGVTSIVVSWSKLLGRNEVYYGGDDGEEYTDETILGRAK